MGLDRTCAVWVLALAAAACSSPAEQLGEEAPPSPTESEGAGAQPGQEGSASDPSNSAPTSTGGAPTGGAGGAPRTGAALGGRFAAADRWLSGCSSIERAPQAGGHGGGETGG